ncbi:MAG: LytTR family DNA-binding domain-containing protein [Eubacteriales bacterium]|nr:LytTR family DNA-binding domain-containing protein [Eubacteriales bacterium]
MNELMIAVCDDEAEDANALRNLVQQALPKAEIRTYASGQSLLKLIESKGNPFHAIFLDIHMPGKSGIETAEEIRKWDRMVPIIFVSCSDNYYREAFDVFAYQYLLKPVDQRDVESVLSLLTEFWERDEEPTIHFRYRAQIYAVRHKQVRYISSSLHTVIFHLTDGRNVHCRGKLNDFTEQLRDSSFVRCHQSFFVNMDAVTGMKTDSFTLDDIIIPISRSFAKEVQESYTQYLEKKKIK